MRNKTRPASGRPALGGKLIVKESGREKIHEICDGPVVVGASPAADVVLRDPHAAQAHCEIRPTQRGFKLVDLETPSGTKVNNLTVNQYMLKNGDTIQIGGAELTFLGDSASPGPPPKRPIKQVPSVQPLGADGEPRRYYRHENEPQKHRRRTNPAVVAFVVVVVVAVALLVFMLKGSAYRSESQKEWDEIVLLLDQNKLDATQRAAKILKSIPGNAIESEDREYMQIKIQKSLKELQDSRRIEARDRRFQDILASFRSGARGVPWLRSQVQAFKHDFPDAPRLPELLAFLRKAVHGTPQNEARFNKAREEIRSYLRVSRFKRVFELLKKLESDPDLRAAFQEPLEVLKGACTGKFKSFYQATVNEALRAHTQGNDKKARELFKMLAEAGLEPYASRAQEHLARLP